ncbi:MAG: hypothetical protein IJF66_00130 [Clostridia bacterium]|nr:hypothetical protein [Clostridia bacterium]
MAKNKHTDNNPQYTRTRTTAENLDLKTQAVETLINSDEESAPEVGAAEIRQYTSSGLDRIPSWIKAVFLKFWFDGAMCFFFLWGLGNVLKGWDIIIVLALATGIITDLLLNNIFRFTASTPHENDKWMMFHPKKYWTLFANIAYSAVIVALVVMTYKGINILINGPESEEVTVAVEPFLYGLLYLVYDLMFIGFKNLLIKIIKDAKAKSAPKPVEQPTQEQE